VKSNAGQGPAVSISEIQLVD